LTVQRSSLRLILSSVSRHAVFLVNSQFINTVISVAYSPESTVIPESYPPLSGHAMSIQCFTLDHRHCTIKTTNRTRIIVHVAGIHTREHVNYFRDLTVGDQKEATKIKVDHVSAAIIVSLPSCHRLCNKDVNTTVDITQQAFLNFAV